MYLLALCLICFIAGSFGRYYMEEPDTATSDFSRLVKLPFYVDKTGFIKEFFESGYNEIYMTAPRGFGKSANMDMLRRYFGVNVDCNGTRLIKEKTDNYALFSNQYVNGEHLNVYKCANSSRFFNNTFGEYPVVHFDFKRVNGRSWHFFIISFTEMMLSVFYRHKYLLNSAALDDAEKDNFTTFFEPKKLFAADYQSCYRGGRILTRLLYRHFRRRVIVLVDEFDKPILDAIFRPSKNLKEIMWFLDHFGCNLLKSNNFVKRALVNGCVRISGHLNNLNHFPFDTNHRFKIFYGFTEPEFKHLAAKYKFENKSDILDEWYGGYTPTNSKFRVYNAFSIVNYIAFRKFKMYWGREKFSLNLPTLVFHDYIDRKITSVIWYKPINVTCTSSFSRADVFLLRELVGTRNDTITIVADKVDLIFNFMLNLGFLTSVGKYAGSGTRTLKIPNVEIRNEISNQLAKGELDRFIGL